MSDRDPHAPELLTWTGERLAAVVVALVLLAVQASLPGPSIILSPAMLGLVALVGLIWWPDSISNIAVGRTMRVPPGFIRALAWFLLASGTLVTIIAALSHGAG